MLFNVLISFAFAMTSPSSGASKELDLQALSFLLGCWQKTDGAETNKEVWNKISDQRFRGKGASLKNGKVVFWENIEITILDGKILYQPAPMGNKSVLFSYENQSTGVSFKKAIFKNMSHDFPQQILYSANSQKPDRLDIELRGVDGNLKPLVRKYFLLKTLCKD